MTILAILTVALAIYGLLALLFQTFRHPHPRGERYGRVIDASNEPSLGCIHPQLRETERQMRAVLAARTAKPELDAVIAAARMAGA